MTTLNPGRPRYVRVGALTYRVITDVAEIRKVSDQADIAADSEWSAFSDHDRLLIGINPNNPADVQRRDLLHEAVHCCLRLAGIWPNSYADVVAKADGQHGGYTVEEFVVSAASAPLLGVLRDNPHLAAWLTHQPTQTNGSRA